MIFKLKTGNNSTHGLSGSPFYTKWVSMMARCYRKSCERYPCYGGRGIHVCDEWKNFSAFYTDMFQSYVEHINKYGRKDTTLDRIDVNGDYCKENCRWATRKEQSLNRRQRKHPHISFNGKTQSIIAWADELGIKRTTLMMRIHTYKWSIEKAFTKR